MITTRDDLIDYCLRSLGSPVVEINVDSDQIEDRVDEAIEYFRQYHYDGIEKLYLKHQITSTDITNKYITIPDLVYGITKVHPIAGSASMSSTMFDLQYQLRLNDLYDLASTSIVYYTQVMSHMSLLNTTLNGMPMYRFNRLGSKLFIDVDWESKISEGQYIVVECYRALDPETNVKMYNEPWLKHYLSALIKRQWGINMKKFDGMQLPGGVTVDGKGLYQEAVEEIKDLETDLMNKSAPLDFMMG